MADEKRKVSVLKAQLQEKFVLDPQFLALFACDGSGKEQSHVGVAIKYIRVTSKVMEQKEIAEELHRHRSRHAISEMVIFEVRAFQFPAAENQLAAGRDLKGLESMNQESEEKKNTHEQRTQLIFDLIRTRTV